MSENWFLIAVLSCVCIIYYKALHWLVPHIDYQLIYVSLFRPLLWMNKVWLNMIKCDPDQLVRLLSAVRINDSDLFTGGELSCGWSQGGVAPHDSQLTSSCDLQLDALIQTVTPRRFRETRRWFWSTLRFTQTEINMMVPSWLSPWTCSVRL